MCTPLADGAPTVLDAQRVTQPIIKHVVMGPSPPATVVAAGCSGAKQSPIRLPEGGAP